MHLFLTSVLPFLAHDHPAAAAFLTCRSHNFHASIIPEFLSDEERVKSFCEARQQNRLRVARHKQYKNLFNLFVQTPLMQFSPALVLLDEDCTETILKPLLETKYFARTLQRCSFCRDVEATNDLLQALAKVHSLTNLDSNVIDLENERLEIIVNSFPSLETLTIGEASCLDPTTTFTISSPPPPATKTVRNLTLNYVDALFAAQFVPHFVNLKKLVLSGEEDKDNKLYLKVLSSSLPLLADLTLEHFVLSEVESLKYLTQLSSLMLTRCKMPDLSFLSASQEESQEEEEEDEAPFLISENKLLTTLCIDECYGFSKSPLASLAHASELRVLRIDYFRFFHDFFDKADPLSDGEVPNKCLEYLDNMVHLRSLHLTISNIVGDSRSLKTLMQNLFQLEELNLTDCRVGNRGAIAGALYSTHSRLRVLNLSYCDLVDDDLNGIGALKNTLEVLGLSNNYELTNEGLMHCKDLVKLKVLHLSGCTGITDHSPLKDCLNLEELNVSDCWRLTDASFKVFSEEPNSFPNLRVFDLSRCEKLTGKIFEHLSKNNQLVYQLKELNVVGMSAILTASETARNNLCQLKGLRQLCFEVPGGEYETFVGSDAIKDLKLELMWELKNLEAWYY